MSSTCDVWSLATKCRVLALGVIVFFIGLTSVQQITWKNSLSLTFLTNQQPNQSDITEQCRSINWPDLRYCTSSEKSTITFGSSFNLSSSYLEELGIPLKDFVPIRRENLDDFVFATAASNGYFHVAMDAIGNIQKLLPNHTIYFYDLDFNRSEEHIRKINSLCGVIYRKFNFSRYPSHVQYLKNYAFKPLIVHDMLSEFPRVFWVDSSIRFKADNLSLTLDEVFSSGGILTFEHGRHSNFEATHDAMYRFLPISAKDAADTEQFGANSVYFHRTEEMYTRIVFWWVLCALREECMSPTHALGCNFKAKDVWAECHRFDQSALNILMANHFHHNVSLYTSHRGQLDVERGSVNKELLVVCPAGTKLPSATYFA